MKWEKSKFSFCTWLIFVITVAGAVFSSIIAGKSTVLYMIPLYIILSGVWFAGAAVVTAILKRFIGNIPNNLQQYKKLPIIVEVVFVTVVFLGGFYIASHNMTKTCEGLEYFGVSKVQEGQGIVNIVHGASYFYLKLLRFVCTIFGNNIEACLWLQIVLYFGAAFIFSRGCRRIWGATCSVLLLVFMVLATELLKLSTNLTPQVLYLLLFAIGFYFTVGCLKERDVQKKYYILIGCIIGLLTYLDITGICLLVIVLCTGNLKEKGKIYNIATQSEVGFCCLSTLVSFLVMIGADAILSGKNILNVLFAWGKIYCPMPVRTSFLVDMDEYSFVIMILYIGLLLAVFSYLNKREYERSSILFLPGVALTFLYVLGFTTKEMDGFPLLLVWEVMIVGMAITNLFDEPERIYEGEEIIIKVEKTDGVIKPQRETIPEVDVMELEPPIQFLDNPLPLPKKHVSKVMDYDIEVADDDDYDIP